MPQWNRIPSPKINLPTYNQLAQTVKNPLATWETWVRSQGWEDPLEKQMATHSSTLAWEIPWMGNRQATVHGTTELDATEHPLNKPAVGFIDFFFQFLKKIWEADTQSELKHCSNCHYTSLE